MSLWKLEALRLWRTQTVANPAGRIRVFPACSVRSRLVISLTSSRRSVRRPLDRFQP